MEAFGKIVFTLNTILWKRFPFDSREDYIAEMKGILRKANAAYQFATFILHVHKYTTEVGEGRMTESRLHVLEIHIRRTAAEQEKTSTSEDQRGGRRTPPDQRAKSKLELTGQEGTPGSTSGSTLEITDLEGTCLEFSAHTNLPFDPPPLSSKIQR
jgi:hypothetical protein